MALKIFDTDTAQAERRTYDFSDDVVGRFRSGFVLDDRPQALGEWRITTGDPEVAEAVAEMYGGEPQEWAAKGEDNIEVFTEADTVDIILDGPEAIRSRMVLRNRDGEIVRAGDGETLTYPEEMAGKPDPEAGLSFAERKENARQGIGAKPETEVTFTLAKAPELGKFRFKSTSWGLVSDIDHYGIEDTLAELTADGGRARARLALKEKSFIAKSGKRKGQKVTFTQPVLRIVGPVKG